MSLNIKSAEADRLARALAAATGESITEATTKALRERLARVGNRERPARDADLQDIFGRAERLPRLSDLDEDQLLGYDENGLPR